VVRIRRARPDDGPGIHVVHTSAIRETCRSHYAPDAIAVWAGRVTPESYGEDLERRDVFVADDDGRVLGFGVLDAGESTVRAVYVHPDAGGHGVGRALLDALETTARLRGVARVHLEASLNAVPFYVAAGWQRERASIRTLAPGRDIACVAMAKRLPPASLELRDATRADDGALRHLHAAAFGRGAEAELVARLRAAGVLAPSLAAVVDGDVVGHVGFSPVAISGAARAVAFGLGPIAVLPVRQGCGLGSRLVEEGLARCREGGGHVVVVLGAPPFYARFGFVSASRFGLRRAGADFEEAFMVAELTPGALAGASGTVHYRPEVEAVDVR
jgi:predicted N-acetyltransferase YhbS